MRARRSPALIRSLEGVRARIQDTFRRLGPSRRTAIIIGSWSAEDLVRHLIGWERANARAIGAISHGRLPDLYTSYTADWAAYNARLVARYRRLRGRELLQEAERSQRRLLERMSRVPAAEWRRDHSVRFRGSILTIDGGLMRFELADERGHLRDLRAVARGRRP